MTSEGISPFVCDSDILLSSLQLVSVECDTVKEVFRRFRRREGQHFACGQISKRSIQLIVLRLYKEWSLTRVKLFPVVYS